MNSGLPTQNRGSAAGWWRVTGVATCEEVVLTSATLPALSTFAALAVFALTIRFAVAVLVALARAVCAACFTLTALTLARKATTIRRPDKASRHSFCFFLHVPSACISMPFGQGSGAH
ncbi:hypothetical protein AR275_18765 [Stenotrophomonas maltophilia]|nr:hypothetical protein AR275_18765 [Stenotrophomonas maltophilia]